MEYDCIICNDPIPDYDPKMCCSGIDCGCMGQPTEPQICSHKCYEKMKLNSEMNSIINNYSWISVKRYYEETPSAAGYTALMEHHKKETEFLVAKCRELAKIILDGDKNNNTSKNLQAQS